MGLGNDAGGATGRIMLPTINGGRTRPPDCSCPINEVNFGLGLNG